MPWPQKVLKAPFLTVKKKTLKTHLPALMRSGRTSPWQKPYSLSSGRSGFDLLRPAPSATREPEVCKHRCYDRTVCVALAWRRQGSAEVMEHIWSFTVLMFYYSKVFLFCFVFLSHSSFQQSTCFMFHFNCNWLSYLVCYASTRG